MTDILVQIVFGWPAILISILLSVAGVWWKKPAFLVAAGIVGIPFAAYLTAASRMPGLLLPLLQFGAAYAVTRYRSLIAWLLITPMVVAAIVLASVVLTQ